jgi:glutamate-5-semialdehyde dehydrogenase
MAALEQLSKLEAGTPLLVGGDKIARVPSEIAERFQPGDVLAVVEGTGEILLIPKAQAQLAHDAVSRAQQAFVQMRSVTDEQIAKFYQHFADNLKNEQIWDQIRAQNAKDVESATQRGRSTTRLIANDKLRQTMIDGLLGWLAAPSQRNQVLERVEHQGWVAELVASELGVVGFVFEGRPNVLADATGVLRGGNTVVFRIGRDALGTAQAMMRLALLPALVTAGLPEGACVLLESGEHAVGWALFKDSRLSLAVARGSGQAVATLGSIARTAGVPVSLHGTGGAWIVAAESASAETLTQAIYDSLDRKVCNTVNTCCIPKSKAKDLIPAVLAGLDKAAQRRGHAYKLHATATAEPFVPKELFTQTVQVRRAEGDVAEPQAAKLAEQDLGREWEWEGSPEMSLTVVDDIDQGVALFNRYSPQFVASLISTDSAEQDRFFRTVNAPFVGDGYTRWVDGQFALNRPELGLSNWERGRLFGRGGILTGDGVLTVRTRMRHTGK